jgi:O-antigen/teichoic acid export membrane protein
MLLSLRRRSCRRHDRLERCAGLGGGESNNACSVHRWVGHEVPERGSPIAKPFRTRLKKEGGSRRIPGLQGIISGLPSLLMTFLKTLGSHHQKLVSLIISSKPGDIHLRELVSGGSLALFYKLMGGFFGYLFLFMISRGLGADSVGKIILSLTILNIVHVLGKLGCDRALVRFVAQHSSVNKAESIRYVYFKILKLCLISGIIASTAVYVFSPQIANHIFNKPDLDLTIRIGAFGILPMILMFINSECLRGLKNITASSLIENVLPLFFSLVLTGLLFLFSFDANFALICYIAGLFIACAVSFRVWFQDSGIGSAVSRGEMTLAAILSISLPMLLSNSMNLTMRWMDTIMLGVFRTEHEVAVYTVALKVAGVTSMILMAINAIATPKFAELYWKNDLQGLRRIVRQSTKIVFWVSLPVLLVIVVFSSFILTFFGKEFTEGCFALLVLACGQFINASSGSVASLLQMTERHKAFQNIMIVGTLLNVILNLLLIPRYGINGAAVATATSVVFSNLASVIYTEKSLKVVSIYIPLLSEKFSKI